MKKAAHFRQPAQKATVGKSRNTILCFIKPDLAMKKSAMGVWSVPIFMEEWTSELLTSRATLMR
jgi:hypothetical protein